MKKAMIPITAMPPATDMPIIGPVPRLLLLLLFGECVGGGVGESEVVEAVLV